MKRISIKTLLVITLAISPLSLLAQNEGTEMKNKFNPIHTGVASLDIAPDARGSSMGDLGVATEPDGNSQFWNPSKYAFSYSPAGVSLSYTPWLRKLVSDIDLAYLAGFWKFGYENNQALSASLRYFSLGEVNLTDDAGFTINSINPYEMAFDLGYSRKLSQSLSMGVALRFIYSDLAYTKSEDVTPGVAVGADISLYNTHYVIVGRNECQWSWGFNISNIGSKISYDGGANSAFLPTNLRIGTTYLFPLSDYNLLSLNLDLTKLLVPAPPQEANYETTEEYQKAKDEYNSMSPITGIFKSFYDAPGGFLEELSEINYSLGLEYSYDRKFFLRAGYYHKNKNKGNIQYFTFGAGFALNVFRLDAAYVVATAQTSPLDQTLRFTLSFDMDGLKRLAGR